MAVARLDDRGVLGVAGADGPAFLQGLVTNNVESLEPGSARYAALLTPQGKVLVDFFVLRPPTPDDLLYIDAPATRIPDMLRRLSMYRLRARIDLADLTGSFDVAAAWPNRPEARDDAFWYADPRDAAAGFRGLLSKGATIADADARTYEAHRIALGLPDGGADFEYGDAFPLEIGMDRLSGVDFNKGCYVGQEVVSRMRHRGSVRSRIVMVAFDGAPPPPGADIRAGDIAVGRMGSSSGSHGLAMMRMDRVEDARTAGRPLLAQGVTLRVASPDA